MRERECVCVCERERERESKYLQIFLCDVIERLWSLKSIEARRRCDSVCSHIVKVDIVTEVKFRKVRLTDLVQTITSGTPKACWICWTR